MECKWKAITYRRVLGWVAFFVRVCS